LQLKRNGLSETWEKEMHTGSHENSRGRAAILLYTLFLNSSHKIWHAWDLVDEVNCTKPFVKHNLHYHSMESGFAMHDNSPEQDITYFSVPR
jgi:hypothetical protein